MVEIDTVSNRVIVGPREALACLEVHLSDVNWINTAPDDGVPVLARLRSAASAMPAKLLCKHMGLGSVVLKFDEAQFGIAAGQAAALYDFKNPDQLLGGGWILHAPLIAKESFK